MINVLVVDDDFRVAQVHATYAAELPGFKVVGVAHTATEAVRATAAGGIQLVLLDTYLPDRLGTEVCRELTEHCDVLMVTAESSAESVRAALRAGAVNYIVKPFTRESLQARLLAYQRFSQRTARGVLTQDQIDTAFAVLHDGDRPQTPKGQSPVTAKLVREALKASDGSRTAAEIAEQVGVARATAQRYLAALAEDGKAQMTLRYGSTGRPEHEYRWR